MGEGGTREISVPPAGFCCEPKTALNKSLFKKEDIYAIGAQIKIIVGLGEYD